MTQCRPGIGEDAGMAAHIKEAYYGSKRTGKHCQRCGGGKRKPQEDEIHVYWEFIRSEQDGFPRNRRKQLPKEKIGDLRAPGLYTGAARQTG